MNTNELLRKRVIVTAYYPNCPFEVGQILKQAHELSMLAGSYHDGGMYVMDTEVEKSTANFRELKFWEFRELKDLPEYVKYEGVVSRVCSLVWNEDYSQLTGIKKYDGKGLFHLDNQYILKGFGWDEVEPSDETEYLNSKK